MRKATPSCKWLINMCLPVWMIMCFDKSPKLTNALLHMWHLCGRTLSWCRMWLASWLDCTNLHRARHLLSVFESQFNTFNPILSHLLTFCRSDRKRRVSLQCADGREQWGSWPGWRLCHKLHKHRASLLLKRFCTVSLAVANINIWRRRNIVNVFAIRWMRYLCECARVAAELQGHWRLSYSEHKCMVSPHCEHAHVSSGFLQDTLRKG